MGGSYAAALALLGESMKEPLMFYIARTDIASINVKLPDGKMLEFGTKTSYQTTDESEIQFLTGVKGLGCRKFTDKEYRGWATAKYEQMPHIGRTDISTIEDVEAYLWRPAFEKIIIEFLKTKDYLVTKKKTKSDKEDNMACKPKPKSAVKVKPKASVAKKVKK
jgi:hypothetical protein